MQPKAQHLAASALSVPPNDRESFTVLQHLDTPQAQPLRMSSRGLLVVSCESGLICGAGGLQRDAVVYGLALADAAFRASFSRAKAAASLSEATSCASVIVMRSPVHRQASPWRMMKLRRE